LFSLLDFAIGALITDEQTDRATPLPENMTESTGVCSVLRWL
jgi:hypothetical protein